MAAPSGTIWGSTVGGYGRIGIYKSLSNTNTASTLTVQVWFWSKYTVDDDNNTLYYTLSSSSGGSATDSKGSKNINTTVASGSGWSTTNQVKLYEYTHAAITRGTSAQTKYLYAKLTNVDRVGGTMTVSTSVSIPALTKYTVSYNANGGSGAPSSQTKYYGKTLTLSSTKPTRTGYTFKGWATSASGSVTYAAGASYTANASVTLYAVWQANTYTIKYNANGGTGAPSNQTKTHGVTLTLSSTKPTRASVNSGDGIVITYTFKGWATSANSSTVAYAAGAKYTSNASVTLYAVWSTATTVTEYDVTYNTNGGSNVSPQVKKKGTALTLRSTIPTKTGYTFKGWGLSEDDTTVDYAAGASYTKDADIVLYAIWTPWTHTVQFNANGGTGTVPSSFTKTTDVDAMIPDSNLSKTNCVFKCWSTKASGSGGTNYYVGDAYEATKNGGTVTLYAIWKERKVLIYKANKNCEAVEFIESDEILGFENTGMVYAPEFIEGNTLVLGETEFCFGELVER